MTEETGFTEPETPATEPPAASDASPEVPAEPAAAAAEPAEAEPAAAAADEEPAEPDSAGEAASGPAAPEVPDNVPSWLREALNYIHERLRALGG